MIENICGWLLGITSIIGLGFAASLITDSYWLGFIAMFAVLGVFTYALKHCTYTKVAEENNRLLNKHCDLLEEYYSLIGNPRKYSRSFND